MTRSLTMRLLALATFGFLGGSCAHGHEAAPAQTTVAPPPPPATTRSLDPAARDPSQTILLDARDAVVTPPPVAPTGISRAPTDAERSAIDALRATTERIRGLRFATDVRIEIRDERSIVDHIARDLEEEELAKGQALYTALGLLPRGMDLVAELRRVLGEQVVGFYDPKERVLVVRDDVATNLPRAINSPLDESRLVLVHELVHALQDQRLGLGAAMEAERDSDADNAFHSLVEGDATLAMLAPLIENMGLTLDTLTARSDLLAQIGPAMAASGPALAESPAIVRLGLVAPYLHGLSFAARLHADGGFPSIDRALAHPPVSMEQVMHPDAYLRREAPVDVRLPAFPALEAAGFTASKEDTLGELELGIYFGQTKPDGYDPASARGWGGDRIRLYHHADGRDAVVWFTTWDDDDAAARAESAARTLLSRIEPRARATHRVARKARAVLIVRGLPTELQRSVEEAFTTYGATTITRRHR